jgi:hypothetical protein
MKDRVNPAVFVGVIVVVVLVACYFGIRALMPDSSRAANTTHGMTGDQKAQYESMRRGSSSSSSEQNMLQHMQAEHQRMQSGH